MHLPLPYVLIIVYIALILIFSVAYYSAWQYNSDCFIVHQEMNLAPLSAWRRMRRIKSKGKIRSKSSPVSLEEVNERFTVLADKEHKIREEARETRQQMNIAKEELDRLGKLHNQEVAANTKALLAQHVSEYKVELAGIQNALQRELKKASTDPQKALEAASAASIAALERFSADLSGPSLLPGATKTTYLVAVTEANDKYRSFLNKTIALDDALTTVQREERELLEPWEKQRLERLKYFEFLYFSIGVATSNTFGDMIPNHRVVRALISLQLVASIVLIGLFLNSVSK